MLRVVFVTIPPARARRLARVLLGERLIACANLLPGVQSVYRWKGRVETARETLLVLKTSARRLPRLMRRITELHPYAVPEIVALSVVKAHRPYADWVARETRPIRRRKRVTSSAPPVS